MVDSGNNDVASDTVEKSPPDCFQTTSRMSYHAAVASDQLSLPSGPYRLAQY